MLSQSKRNNRIHLAIIGSRGIPPQYGGFETAVDELTKVLSKYPDLEITVVCDSEHREKFGNLSEYNGAKLEFSKFAKGKNPMLFYRDSIEIAVKKLDADVILCCGVGASFWAFVPSSYGKKLILNPDGLEWKRSKYNFIQRLLLKTLEILSIRYSDYIACDSVAIKDYVNREYPFARNKTFVIEYGAWPNKFVGITDQKIREVLEKFSLEPFQYYIVVSRIVPENNLDHIIRGFINSGTNKKLLIVGSFSNDKFSKALESLINKHKDRILAPGGIYDKDELEILRANATAYIHGHSVGGTNPSLLEAMASRNFCVCHDNPFNREVADNLGLYFKNAEELADNIQIIEKMDEKNLENIRDRLFKRIVDYYNWEKIGERWYKKILNLQN